MSDAHRIGWAALLAGALSFGPMCLMSACSKAPVSQVNAAAVRCVPRGLGAMGLDAEWQAFAAHIQACAIIAPDGIPALELITISAQSYYRSLPEGSQKKPRLPRPMVLLPGGHSAARLLYNFPDDPPLVSNLVFEAWDQSIPHRIRIYISSPTQSGSRELTPLLWDEATRSYQGGREPAR